MKTERRLGTGRLWALAALFVALAPGVHAQPAACRAALTEAEELYRDGRFDDVERQLDPCFGGADVPTPAYRLLALGLVRQQRLAEAQDVVVRLLVADPAYTPDDVQDPPVYVALVRLVARQLVARPSDPQRPAPVVVRPLSPRPAAFLPESARRPVGRSYPVRPLVVPEVPSAGRAFRRPGTVAAEAAAGAESYDGERRQVGEGLVGGFATNGGLSASAGLSVQALRWLSVGLTASTLRLPGLIRDGLTDFESGYLTDPAGTLGFPVTTYATLDPATTGRRVSSAMATVRADLTPGRRVSPYVRAGVRTTARRINGALRFGVGPEGAFGVEAAATPRLAVFGEATGALVSDSALDAAVYRRNGDLLLGARLGLRVRLTELP